MSDKATYMTSDMNGNIKKVVLSKKDRKNDELLREITAAIKKHSNYYAIYE